MDHLPKLFKLMEITRSQPQYGYSLIGLRQDDLSNLAEHHYLVSFFAWQLAREAKRSGASIDVEKVLEFALIHDLGELFGGDISMPYAKLNRRARVKAKEFELLNQKFVAKFFGKDRNYVRKMMEEILAAKSDEALIVKIADYAESAHFLFYARFADKALVERNGEKMKGYAKKIKDEKAREAMEKFIKSWEKEFLLGEVLDIISETR